MTEATWVRRMHDSDEDSVSTVSPQTARRPPRQALFFDYLTALAVRNNSLTGVAYRHDPTILAWDLAHRWAGGRVLGGFARRRSARKGGGHVV